MAPFLHVSEGKNSLTRKKQKPPIIVQNCKPPFTSKSAISNQLISYKATAIALSPYYHLIILDIDTILSLIVMNEQIMKKLFSGIHGLVPNPPKMPIVGKESNPKLVKRSK